MSEHVWVTDFMSDITLILRITVDISVKNTDAAVKASLALQAGQAVPADRCPKAVWMDKGRKGPKSFPPIFYANGNWVVSRNVADILRGFDLGEGGLHPVDVLRSDKETPVGGDWFCWIFGNRKDTLDAEASVNLRQLNPNPLSVYRNLAISPCDDDVALSRVALVGPEVWIEKRLNQTVLLSGALGDALAAAGFRKALRMTRARVV